MRYKVFDIVNADIVFSSDDKNTALDFISENCEKYGCLILIDIKSIRHRINTAVEISEVLWG